MFRIFSDRAWEDYTSWQSDPRVMKRINTLIKAIENNPYEGIGKPESLKEPLEGYWSRRIDATNRIIYRITNSQKGEILEILQVRYNY